MRCRAALLLLALAVGCNPAGPVATTVPAPTSTPRPAADLFADVTAGSGLAFTYRNGEEADQYSILESLGGGVALLDYDRDGRLDVFVTGGGGFGPNNTILGHPNRLFRNEGHGKFRDVTAEVGLPTEGPLFFSHGAAVADFDNDGWPDLLVTGYGRLALYRNDHGRFVDVTARAGLLRHGRPLHWSTSAAWGDLDGDGFPDLYVAHYLDWSFANNPRCGIPAEREVCHPRVFKPLRHAIYRNNRDGTFTDMTDQVGLKAGKGLGVLIADLDGDGRNDVYVANDTDPNFLYLNQGDWHFTEVAVERGAAGNEQGRPDGSMGVAVGDYDRSGRLSLVVTNFEGEFHALYQPRANGQYAHASRRAGLAALGTHNVGFGVGFVDLDRDGFEDLVISNGHVARHPDPPATRKQRPTLLWHNGHSGDRLPAYGIVTDQGGPYFRQPHAGRGLALGDLDDDGRVDLVISHVNEPVTLLRNVSDDSHHWLGIGLEGRPGRDAVGARLTLEVNGQTLLRTRAGGGSYLSSGDPRIVFGLGGATTAGPLTVRWPSGRVQTWKGLAVDRYWYLVEGEEAPRAAPLAPGG